MSVKPSWGIRTNHLPLNLVALLSAATVLGLSACAEPAPTEPSTGASLALAAAGTYTAVDLGTLPGGAASLASGINRNRQVVGESNTTGPTGPERHAFLWSGGVMRDLGTLGGNFSRAFGINDVGKVVGGSARSDGHVHAFLWTNGVMRDLGTLGGPFSEAHAINAAGQVVGWSTTDAASVVFHAFLWENGIMKDLGTLGGNYSQAFGINPLGQIVGESKTAGGKLHAFLWVHGSMTDLRPLGGRSQGLGINRSGRVVGASEPFPRATVWVNGSPRFWGPPGQMSGGFGLNAAGLVAGTTQKSGVSNAVLWTKGVMTILPAIGGGPSHGQALGINAAGDIAGETDRGGITHATLWTHN